jgi:hypothetical protein
MERNLFWSAPARRFFGVRLLDASLECAGLTALWSAAARRRHSWQSIAAWEQELISAKLRQVAADQSGVQPPHSKSVQPPHSEKH